VTHDHSLLPHFDRVVPFEPFLKRTEPVTATASDTGADL